MGDGIKFTNKFGSMTVMAMYTLSDDNEVIVMLSAITDSDTKLDLCSPMSILLNDNKVTITKYVKQQNVLRDSLNL